MVTIKELSTAPKPTKYIPPVGELGISEVGREDLLPLIESEVDENEVIVARTLPQFPATFKGYED